MQSAPSSLESPRASDGHQSGPLRVALLAYRGNPHSGGQGVYVRNLSKALTHIGHHVTVFAGQPYPQLDPRVPLVKLPSLDLYRQPDPFRIPRPREIRDHIDLAEIALMLVATFPEPLTFSLRARRALRQLSSRFDIVHDNQGLGYGMLSLQRMGMPVMATVHHAVAIDRRAEMQAARARRDVKNYLGMWRWYSFAGMQNRVARKLPRILTVSDAAREDIVREMGLQPGRVAVVGNGVDAETFLPKPHVERVPGRILTTSSSDVPLKGLVFLLEAVAKIRTERHCELVVIGKPKPESTIPRSIARFGLEGAVRFVSGIDDDELAELYASSEVAVVPSLYEGFSLPAVEAMACGVPLVATTGGALPEVAGRNGETALLVPPADAGALTAAIRRLLDDPELRARIGCAGRGRALQKFTWDQAARATAQHYREVAAGC